MFPFCIVFVVSNVFFLDVFPLDSAFVSEFVSSTLIGLTSV